MNPYTYIFNNPLSGTDPTGYCAENDDFDTCGGDLQAGESEEYTNEDGGAIGTVSRGDNNEKIYNIEGQGTFVIENGYEGDRQTVKSVNDGKISNLKSQINDLVKDGGMENISQISDLDDGITALENQTEFFGRCTNSPGGCGHSIDGGMAGLFTELTQAFGNLVASSATGGSSSSASTSGFQKIRIRTNAIISNSNKPINSQGLSQAANAWDKHAGRPGGACEMLSGNTATKNATAESFVRNVISNPRTTQKNLSGGAVEYRLPNNGKGIRVEKDGKINFVDPYRGL